MIETIHFQLLLAAFARWSGLSGHRPFPVWYNGVDVNANMAKRTELIEGTMFPILKNST
jgi:hypothetical protein